MSYRYPGTEFLLECAIFDDGDVLPTVMLGQFNEPHPVGANVEWFYIFNTMRMFAEQEYGRKAPDHALFWQVHPKPFVAQRGGVDRSHRHDIGGEA